MARPSFEETAKRREIFARLVAHDDTKLVEAAKAARIDPWRALKLLSDPDFRHMVDHVPPGEWTTAREA